MRLRTAEPRQRDTAGTPAVARRQRPPFAGAVWLAVVLAGALIAGLAVGVQRFSAPPPRPTVAVASVPYWNIQHGTETVLHNRHAITEVSPWIYGLDRAGQIDTQYRPGQTELISADIKKMRAAGLPIVPSLANITDGQWSYQPVARMLHSPALMSQQIDAIVALVEANNYAGIDIDYEQLRAGDRQDFTTFCERLASALHAKGKVFSVALFAKASNNGNQPTNAAQDYHAIGQVADQVRLMGYDYHWAGSGPGPIAPIGWIRSVLSYAKTQIPAGKIILGVPLYGYDWAGGRGTPVSWLQAFQLSERYAVQPRFDGASQSPWFAYTDASGRRHVVWFENGPSTQAKFEAAESAGIGGVYVWIYGLEDTSIWSALRQSLPHRVPASSIAQPGT